MPLSQSNLFPTIEFSEEICRSNNFSAHYEQCLNDYKSEFGEGLEHVCMKSTFHLLPLKLHRVAKKSKELFEASDVCKDFLWRFSFLIRSLRSLSRTHPNPLEPRGLSDCVEKALDVTLTTDSMSESPKSPIKSLSGEREFLGLRRVSAFVRSLSDSPE